MPATTGSMTVGVEAMQPEIALRASFSTVLKVVISNSKIKSL